MSIIAWAGTKDNTLNSRDTIPIRPTTNQVLRPQDTLCIRLKAARKLSSMAFMSALDIIPSLRAIIPCFIVLINNRAFCPA